MIISNDSTSSSILPRNGVFLRCFNLKPKQRYTVLFIIHLTILFVVVSVSMIVGISTSISSGISMLFEKSDLNSYYMSLEIQSVFDEAKLGIEYLAGEPEIKSYYCNTNNSYSLADVTQKLFRYSWQAAKVHPHHIRIVCQSGAESVRIDFNHSSHPMICPILYNVSQREYHRDFLEGKSINSSYFNVWTTHGPTHEDSYYEYYGEDLDGDHNPGHVETFPFPSLVKGQRAIMCDGEAEAYVIFNIRMSVKLGEFDLITHRGEVFLTDEHKDVKYYSHYRHKEFQKIRGIPQSFDKDFGGDAMENILAGKEKFSNSNYHFSCKAIDGAGVQYFLCTCFTRLDALRENPFPLVIGLCVVFFFFLFANLTALGVVFILRARKRIKQTKKLLEEFEELEDIDILMQENKLNREDVEFSLRNHLKDHQKFFSITFSDLRFTKELGRGAGGVVYKGVYNEKNVAIKQLNIFKFNDSQLKQFEREMSILRKVDHKNMLKIYGCSSTNNRIAAVMEFCENDSYKKWLKSTLKTKKIGFSFPERMRLLRETVRGMLYLHDEHQIIHRDLKTDNLLLTGDLTVKIADFGLSKIVNLMEMSKTSYVGTSLYMAPEVVLGSKYDFSVDVYSFGIVLYEIAFEQLNPYGITMQKNKCGMNYIEFKIANNPDFRPIFPPEKVEQTPMFLRDLMQSCWKHEASERKGFAEIMAILEENSWEDVVEVSVGEKEAVGEKEETSSCSDTDLEDEKSEELIKETVVLIEN